MSVTRNISARERVAELRSVGHNGKSWRVADADMRMLLDLADEALRIRAHDDHIDSVIYGEGDRNRGVSMPAAAEPEAPSVKVYPAHDFRQPATHCRRCGADWHDGPPCQVPR